MPVTELNHYSHSRNDLERTKDFYCKVLGFGSHAAADFPFSRLLARINARSRCIWLKAACRLGALLPRQPEERGQGQFRRGRPYRFPRHGTRKLC